MTKTFLSAALLAASVSFAQEPVADAGRPRKTDGGTAAAKADAGAPKTDAGAPKTDAAAAADAGTPAAAGKPKVAFALAKDSPTLDKWSKTKPEGRAALGLLKGVKIGERAFLGIFVEGYSLPASRKVDLAADIIITDCDKRIVLEKANVAGTRTMDPAVNIAVPLTPTVELNYGNTDPDCAYNVRITVFDLNRGVSWSTEGTFPVTR